MKKDFVKFTYHRFLLIGFIFFSVIVSSYPVYTQAISSEEYREKLRLSLDVLESVKEQDAFPEQALILLRDIFPYNQIVVFNGRQIKVNNTSFLSLINECEKSKDKKGLKYNIESLRRKIFFLVKETRIISRDTPVDLRVKVSEILSRKEFFQKKLNPFLQKLYDWFKAQLDKIKKSLGLLISGFIDKLAFFLERFLKFIPQRVFNKPAKSIFHSFTIFFYAIAVTSAAVFLIFFIRNKWYLYFFKKSKAKKPVFFEESGIQGLRQWQAVRNHAEAALNNGNIKLAFHYVYLSLLFFLDQKRILIYHESLTNWEYTGQLRQYPVLFKNFRDLTARFEHIWYGQEDCDLDDYNEFIQGYNQIVNTGSNEV